MILSYKSYNKNTFDYSCLTAQMFNLATWKKLNLTNIDSCPTSREENV